MSAFNFGATCAALLCALALSSPVSAAVHPLGEVPASSPGSADSANGANGANGTSGPADSLDPQLSRGLVFRCTDAQRDALKRDVPRYLDALGATLSEVITRDLPDQQTLVFTLKPRVADALSPQVSASTTLDFASQPRRWVYDDEVPLPSAAYPARRVLTVSQREIALALMNAGRVSEFSGAACSVAALREHIGLRQNIVAWAENLTFRWPDGRAASWNTRLWRDGTPRSRHLTAAALRDVLRHPERYFLGCYTTAKLVIAAATFDYYDRVLGDKAKAQLVLERLWSNGDPLTRIEPRAMWAFEPDFDQRELNDPGKLLRLTRDVAPENFVPGDWAYFYNTDEASHAKTGYEGSNAIYLGRGRFSDYYNDNARAYTYDQKLDEVYQWRHGVFSRSRNKEEVEALAPSALRALGQPPHSGGFVMTYRATPYFFGHESLPTVPRD